MTDTSRVTLFEFLRNPRECLPRLNGWQRTWVISSTVLFAIHVLVLIAILPSIDRMYPDVKHATASTNELEATITKDRQDCSAAFEARERAEKENHEFNQRGREQARTAVC